MQSPVGEAILGDRSCHHWPQKESYNKGWETAVKDTRVSWENTKIRGFSCCRRRRSYVEAARISNDPAINVAGTGRKLCKGGEE
ncbi:hypothetical protein HAX54_036434 [Datura stramonium]|uniref:Uncharacterized protein n=1 Tax=Datura stramonium TaxID=4076 RepID=A0ABS8SG19_DATST|nr:hypothetical protein [Datura stramonium]